MTTVKKTTDTCYSGKMKLADMIDTNFNLLAVLQRFGISLSLSDRSVEDVCARYGIDVDTFLLICNVYTYSHYIPSNDILGKGNVADVVKYLHMSHSYYMSIVLASLEGTFGSLISPCSEKKKAVVWKFFTDYKQELEKHFAYEEGTLFPYVKDLLAGKPGESFSASQFEENHSNIEEKLGDFKNIVMKYLPEECDDQLRIQVLISIYHLESDLDKHTRIENDILVPMLSKIEDHGRK